MHVCFFLFLSICVCTCPGATYYVDASRPDDSGDGTTWATAKHTIQAAVDLAGNADTVLVTNGVYSEGGDLTNRVHATAGHYCDIRAVGSNRADTVIDGAGTNRCFKADDTAAWLIGFTLTNGFAAGATTIDEGGGAWCGTLTNCLITNCKQDGNQGGGTSRAVLYNCTIRFCTAPSGGADFYSYIYNSVIINNSATNGNGGGTRWSKVYNSLICSNSAATDGGGCCSGDIYDCVVRDNYAGRNGGAGYTTDFSGSTLENNVCVTAGGGLSRSAMASNCVIRGNTAGVGGAAGHTAGYPHRLYNCLIVSNTAARCGGVYQPTGLQPATLINCTVVSNIATESGFCAGCSFRGSAWSGPFVITNSIIRYNMNTADGVETNYGFTADSSIGYSLTWPDVGGAGYDNGGNVSSDPVFADGHDFKVLYRSPCVDSGINISTLSNDLDNVTRPVDGKGNGTPAYDMGCYEYIPPPGGTILNFR